MDSNNHQDNLLDPPNYRAVLYGHFVDTAKMLFILCISYATHIIRRQSQKSNYSSHLCRAMWITEYTLGVGWNLLYIDI